jgi:hypothetical protein
VFGRYMATRDKKPSAFGKTGNVLTTVNPAHRQPGPVADPGRHHGVRATTWSTRAFAFNRTAVDRDKRPYFDRDDLGVKAYSYVPHQMIIVP